MAMMTVGYTAHHFLLLWRAFAPAMHRIYVQVGRIRLPILQCGRWSNVSHKVNRTSSLPRPRGLRKRFDGHTARRSLIMPLQPAAVTPSV